MHDDVCGVLLPHVLHVGPLPLAAAVTTVVVAEHEEAEKKNIRRKLLEVWKAILSCVQREFQCLDKEILCYHKEI